MNEFEAEVLAVTNFHHFLLEVVLAQSMAASPDGKAHLDALRDGLMARIKQRMTFRPGENPDDEAMIELKTRMLILGRRFFERAEARRSEIAAASR